MGGTKRVVRGHDARYEGQKCIIKRLCVKWQHAGTQQRKKKESRCICEEQDRRDHSLVADSLSGFPAALLVTVLLFSLGDGTHCGCNVLFMDVSERKVWIL